MYHPSSNGQVERFMKPLRDMLVSFIMDKQNTWDAYLRHILFAYNTSWNPDIDETPFYLIFGRDPRLPTDMEQKVQPDVSRYRAEITKRLQEAYHSVREIHEKTRRKIQEKIAARTQRIPFQIGQKVWAYFPRNPGRGVAQKLLKQWEGPFRIIGLEGTVATLQSGTNVITNIHVNRLKPYYDREPPEVLEAGTQSKEGDVMKI